MNFIWHDGGRAACGFVGTTGDCVTRSIAIATGTVYRDVYKSLSELSEKTARHGIAGLTLHQYLADQGWGLEKQSVRNPTDLPRGIVLVEFDPTGRKRHGHLSCVIDHTVYDTWNPFEDEDFQISAVWTCATRTGETTLPITSARQFNQTDESSVTQQEYDRILKRVRALHRTASNEASTEGEIRNALRAMQALMLKHNLSRSDIVEDDNVDKMGMTRRACPLNGSRACQWESSLARYLTLEIFPTVQFYRDRQGHRTFFWFYGPVDDVEQTLGLFREMLLTIATAARLKYGGHSRGSGASYAEGYVKGLPTKHQAAEADDSQLSENALIYTRTLTIHSAALEWLEVECGIRLRTHRRAGRGHFDSSAHRAGKRDGAKHEYSGPGHQKRIAFRPGD